MNHIGTLKGKFDHESLEKSVQKVIRRCEPDTVIATISSNPSKRTDFVGDNQRVLVKRIFKAMDVDVEVVSAKDKGRMEVLFCLPAPCLMLTTARTCHIPILFLSLTPAFAFVLSNVNRF